MGIRERLANRGCDVVADPQRRKLAQGISGILGMMALVGSEVAALTACSSEDPETLVDKLVDKFGQNFNPYEYQMLSENAYTNSKNRDPDPDSRKVCKDQDVLIKNEDALVEYLAGCKSRQRILDFFKVVALNQYWNGNDVPVDENARSLEEKVLCDARSLKMDHVVIDDGRTYSDLYIIFALLGRDPEMYIAFIKAVLTYRGWDLSPEDTFRDPVSTIRSGWADCDDWTVLHYFWAHIHGYSPNLVVAVTPESEAISTGPNTKMQNGHTLVWYETDSSDSVPEEMRGKMVVLDNGSFTLLPVSSDIGIYLNEEYPGKNLSLEFNGPWRISGRG